MSELISRNEIIDILAKMQFFQGQRAGRELWNDKSVEVQDEDIKNFNRDIQTIRKYILQLEEKSKWIPCSERLPGENIPVLTCDKDGWISVNINVPYTGRKNAFECGYYVAWMPLPEAYKEGLK